MNGIDDSLLAAIKPVSDPDIFTQKKKQKIHYKTLALASSIEALKWRL